MNKNGFTLIELLAVIIILLLLSTIIVPIIRQDMLVAENYASDSQVRLIEETAYIYALNYKDEISTIDTNNIAIIQVQALLDKGLITDKDLKVNNKDTVKSTDKVIIAKIEDNIKAIYDKKQENKPIIILHGPSKIKLSRNGTYFEYGASVINISPASISDIPLANITSNVNVSTPGSYKVTYTYNNANSVVREVEISDTAVEADNERPVITLIGSDTINISQGSTYTELGATAFDNKDGNITNRIVITGTVNTKIKGTYYIKYDVVDLYGNKAITVTRKVIVN